MKTGPKRSPEQGAGLSRKLINGAPPGRRLGEYSSCR